MYRALIGCLLIVSFGVSSDAQEQEATDPWKLVRLFEGSWTGSAEGRFGSSTVERTYTFILDDAYLHEENISTYPPQEFNPDGEVHEHWSFFSYDRAQRVLVLRQFHDEHIVNHFVLNTGLRAEGVIVFDSESMENYQQDWRAREKYRIMSKDAFIEEFYLAPPGQDFELYITTHLERTD